MLGDLTISRIHKQIQIVRTTVSILIIIFDRLKKVLSRRHVRKHLPDTFRDRYRCWWRKSF